MVGILAAVVSACAATASESAGQSTESSKVAATATAEAHLDEAASKGVTGVWEGTSIAYCTFFTLDPGRCDAIQNIEFTMIQQGNVVTGYYKCAYGNRVCRNMDETGVIKDGKMIGKRIMFRVMLEDGSMCIYSSIPNARVMEGSYSCLQGAGQIEGGSFHTQRSY